MLWGPTEGTGFISNRIGKSSLEITFCEQRLNLWIDSFRNIIEQGIPESRGQKRPGQSISVL